MNEHEQLEQELAWFRPAPPSPELREHVAAKLSVVIQPVVTRRRNRFVFALSVAGGVLAVLIGVFWRSIESMPLPTRPELSEPSLATAMDEELPSVWAYRAVLGESPEALHELLDKHVDRSTKSESSSIPDAIFARFERESEILTGEL